MGPIRFLLLLVIAFPLAGCFSQADILAIEQGENGPELAQDYYSAWHPSAQATQIKQIMISRNLVPPADWPDIDHHIVDVGMDVVAVEASWGEPTTINTTTDAQGDMDQWVYRSCDTCSASYVYISNGVVTSIQSSE